MPFLFFASIAAGDLGQAVRDETDNSLADKKRKREQVLPDLPQVRVKCMNKSNGG